MTDHPSTFVWYELMSSDLDAARAFYTQVVGWHTEELPLPGMAYTMLSAGDTPIGGMMTMPERVRAAGAKPRWLAHIATQDVDAAAAKVTRLGGTIHRPPTDIENVGRYAVAADRQGAAFYLFKPAKPGAAGVSEAPGSVGWHELHSTDWPDAMAFYGEMFGWQKGDPFDMGPMGTYQLFTVSGRTVGGMFNSSAAKTQSKCFWLYYFRIDDIDAGARRIREYGGTITNGPHQVPGGGWIIQASDPQGAAFALLGTRANS